MVVFIEFNIGSDFGSLCICVVCDGDDWLVMGNKIWIIYVQCSYVMMFLVCIDFDSSDWCGLLMFLVCKIFGIDDDLFLIFGMIGGEIEVLGYCGMKEYELGFDGFCIWGEDFLGVEFGCGFKQLMEIFEFVWIQIVVCVVGVVQFVCEIGL